MPPTIYKGRRMGHARGDVMVTVNGATLDPRHDLFEHAKRMDWGSGVPEASQLALAILAHHCGLSSRALTSHQAFKWQVVAKLPIEGWTLTEDEVREALERIERGTSRR